MSVKLDIASGRFSREDIDIKNYDVHSVSLKIRFKMAHKHEIVTISVYCHWEQPRQDRTETHCLLG